MYRFFIAVETSDNPVWAEDKVFNAALILSNQGWKTSTTIEAYEVLSDGADTKVVSVAYEINEEEAGDG